VRAPFPTRADAIISSYPSAGFQTVRYHVRRALHNVAYRAARYRVVLILFFTILFQYYWNTIGGRQRDTAPRGIPVARRSRDVPVRTWSRLLL